MVALLWSSCYGCSEKTGNEEHKKKTGKGKNGERRSDGVRLRVLCVSAVNAGSQETKTENESSRVPVRTARRDR